MPAGFKSFYSLSTDFLGKSVRHFKTNVNEIDILLNIFDLSFRILVRLESFLTQNTMNCIESC